MPETMSIETGEMGRVAYARVGPNEDLVHAVEKFCLAEEFKHAFVRGALGSLVDACLIDTQGRQQRVCGPAVEIVSLAGEVRSLSDGSISAALTGVVADTRGAVYGGLFTPGSNTVCMTLEVTLEEWLPIALSAPEALTPRTMDWQELFPQQPNLSRIELASLKLVVACAREGSLSAAAAACHLSVAGASSRLRRLEELLGTSLFDRHHRGLTVTTEGSRVVTAACQVFGELKAMHAAVCG